MKTITKFESFDGQVFDTETECRTHEAARAHQRLAGLTPEQVEAAIARTDLELADAFEIVGAKITRLRLDSGERKRKRAPKDAPAAPEDRPPIETMNPAEPLTVVLTDTLGEVLQGH